MMFIDWWKSIYVKKKVRQRVENGPVEKGVESTCRQMFSPIGARSISCVVTPFQGSHASTVTRQLVAAITFARLKSLAAQCCDWTSGDETFSSRRIVPQRLHRSRTHSKTPGRRAA
ncbi:hypothetical protein [Dyella solisilvae]|uniref:hypothetical protein n=1 Tax=Dyella solisilvae TaxID=1920168 RepID=UPI0011C037FB|nr:hypothetical protein [Dyella solisilvae]